MIDEKILRKIKKCLALSASSNPHEAANALRQAHALMTMHGVTSETITMSEIGEFESKSRTMSRNKPAQWETLLASIVGRAFGCQIMFFYARTQGFGKPLNDGTYVFVGLKHQAEVAAYTVSVLSRKCKTLRQAWLTENLSALGALKGGRAKMTKMGDKFTEGWCSSIEKLVMMFANPVEVDAAINSFVQLKTKGAEFEGSRKVKNSGRDEMVAALAGAQAAKDVSLFRSVNPAEKQLAIT